ncbi:carbamoyltransferase HypF [Parafrankia discariae]|uniref:carbamoyltransferase HypF n=1 Tax=Parafrankia discariae TaxID=365528 RepID=UPI0012B68DF0
MSGQVANDAEGVHIALDGAAPDIAAFLAALREEAPLLAQIDSVDVSGGPAPPGAGPVAPGFRIAPSDPARGGAGPRTRVCADSATCADCLAELADPADRRYRYPFINCTNCGPRFTIIRDVPYDRPATTMAGFRMCARCRAEYEDPADRRFHAQPVCCPDCGPTLSFQPTACAPTVFESAVFEPPGAAAPASAGPLERAAGLLRAGGILAVKGLGGYHLAVLAADESAVAALRRRKHRDAKPFAVMVRDLATVEEMCCLDPTARVLLTGRRRPIVLVERCRRAGRVAPSVAPGTETLGLMLPYTPLHHLLLGLLPGPIVLTSGNISDEPIVYRDDEAFAALRPVADGFLTHDRAIHTRLDDSVARSVRGRETLVRRSRGYAPEPLALPWDVHRPVLACGAELKNTVCLAAGRRAYLSGHIGDLENHETLRSFVGGIDHLRRLFDISPELVAHDLHPEYLSTKWALEQDLPVVGVQHHHAHIASCLADNGQPGPVLGVAFDGLGYGPDGTLWGGEFLWADLAGFTRLAHLAPVPMPGGAAAVRAPWRMAAAHLLAAGVDDQERLAVARRNADRWAAVTALAGAGTAPSPVGAPLTSSVGRLFDAVAALVGVRDTITYEGQAAVELERIAAPGDYGRYPASIPAPGAGLLSPGGGAVPPGGGAGPPSEGGAMPSEGGAGPSGGGLRLPGADLIRGVVDDLRERVDPAVIAARFHSTLAGLTVDTCVALYDRLPAAPSGPGIPGLPAGTAGTAGTVALSGGVFGNLRLLGEIVDGLVDRGFTVLTHSRVPCNDGGISLGQAVVANARGQRRT